MGLVYVVWFGRSRRSHFSCAVAGITISSVNCEYSLSVTWTDGEVGIDLLPLFIQTLLNCLSQEDDACGQHHRYISGENSW